MWSFEYWSLVLFGCHRFDTYHHKFGGPPSTAELPSIAELSLNLRDSELSFRTPQLSSLRVASIGGEATEPRNRYSEYYACSARPSVCLIALSCHLSVHVQSQFSELISRTLGSPQTSYVRLQSVLALRKRIPTKVGPHTQEPQRKGHFY